MSNYWILCISQDNFEISVKNKMIAMSENKKRAIEQMAVDDLVVFYITRLEASSQKNDKTQEVRCFRGIARIIGPVLESNDVIWKVKSSELFPYRRKVEFINTDLNVPIKPLINELSFVENTAYWGIAFQKGYTKITEQDFELIKKTSNL